MNRMQRGQYLNQKNPYRGRRNSDSGREKYEQWEKKRQRAAASHYADQLQARRNNPSPAPPPQPQQPTQLFSDEVAGQLVSALTAPQTNPALQATADAAGAAGQNIFGQASDAYTEGVGALSHVANPYAASMSMNQFMSPYRERVINDAVSRLRDRRSDDLNMVRGQAAQASAFGGARQGLVEAELIDRYGRNEDELASRLLQQGFDTSANLAFRNLDSMRGAGSALVGAAPTGVQMGQAALGMQASAGAQQQSFLQRLLDESTGNYQNYANYPQQSLSTALAGIQGNPLANASQTTEQYNPGLFDYLSFGAGVFGGGK